MWKFALFAIALAQDAPPPPAAAPPPPVPPPPPPAPPVPPPPPPPPAAPAAKEEAPKHDPHKAYDDHYNEIRKGHYKVGRVPSLNASEIVEAHVHAAPAHVSCGAMPGKRAVSHEWHVNTETPEKCCEVCRHTSRCTMWAWGTGAQGHYQKCWITTSESKLEDAPGFITGSNPGRMADPPKKIEL